MPDLNAVQIADLTRLSRVSVGHYLTALARDDAASLALPGIGEAKLQRYGAEFLTVIAEFEDDS